MTVSKELELTHKVLRQQREFEGLFKNPKHARTQWADKVVERWGSPAMEPIAITDKDGNLTPQSQVEAAVWEHLLDEIAHSDMPDRWPTEGEMMEACQQYYARHNASSYVARRDSMGAKPIDETKQNLTMNNPLEGLTDEELEIMENALIKHQEELEAEKEQVNCIEQPEECEHCETSNDNDC